MRLLPPLQAINFRKGGDKGCRQGPFGKKTPQQVGDGEGHEKGIGHETGTEGPSDDHVPDESGDAAEECRQSHDSRCAGYSLFFFLVFHLELIVFHPAD